MYARVVQRQLSSIPATCTYLKRQQNYRQ
jgi:hypothetical protein